MAKTGIAGSLRLSRPDQEIDVLLDRIKDNDENHEDSSLVISVSGTPGLCLWQ